jgi:hypothetical protein
MRKITWVSILVAQFVGAAWSGEPFNNANLWKSYSEQTKRVYVDGFADGVSETFIAAAGSWIGYDKLKEPVSEKVKKVRDRVFIRYTQEQIPAVMSDLYKDPANDFVLFQDILLIARDRIEGKKTEELLNEARKKAMDSHEINEKENNK